MLHGLLLHLLPVLHPGHGGGGGVEVGLEGGGRPPVHCEGERELDKVRGGSRLSGNVHHQRAGGETLSDVIECLAGVGPGVLGEDLVDV